MKKNKFMRIASVMLMLCVITTCAISGTFAKYTTAENANDSARVAKWGVVITTAGTLFAEQYKDASVDDAADNGDNITVKVASTGTNVVAPGTKNDTGITFVINGTAEVDLKLEIAVDIQDISLAKETSYEDYTTGNGEDTFTLAEDYHPVKFTLKQNDEIVETESGDTMSGVTLDEIKTYLVGLTNSRINANTDLGDIYGTYNLTWAWAFEGNDAADTYLAKQETPQTISFGITITATQLD